MYNNLEEKNSLENLAYQLFEFILILKDKKKHKETVKKAIDELYYFSILYMQITEEQVINSLKLFKLNFLI